MTLGEQLHAYRKSSGRKVGAILDHMGIAKATLYWWEGPKSRPDPADIDRLLAFYGCTEAEIEVAQTLRRLLPAPVRARSGSSEPSDPPTAGLVEEVSSH